VSHPWPLLLVRPPAAGPPAAGHSAGAPTRTYEPVGPAGLELSHPASPACGGRCTRRRGITARSAGVLGQPRAQLSHPAGPRTCRALWPSRGRKRMARLTCSCGTARCLARRARVSSLAPDRRRRVPCTAPPLVQTVWPWLLARWCNPWPLARWLGPRLGLLGLPQQPQPYRVPQPCRGCRAGATLEPLRPAQPRRGVLPQLHPRPALSPRLLQTGRAACTPSSWSSRSIIPSTRHAAASRQVRPAAARGGVSTCHQGRGGRAARVLPAHWHLQLSWRHAAPPALPHACC
jgi:hypothetical protein